MRRATAAVVVVAAVALVGCSSSSNGDGSAASSETTVLTQPSTTAPRALVAEPALFSTVDPAYRQGVARTPNGWIFSFNDGLFRTDDGLLKQVEKMPAIPDDWKAKGYDHIGDIDVEGGVVYAPIEQDDYGRRRQAMFTYDAETLEFRSAVEVEQGHNSFVTVDPATNIAYSMDQFGGDALLRYDVANGWKPLDPLPMSMFVDRVQGGDVYDGAVWLSTDDDHDGLYRVDLATGQVTSLGGFADPSGEGEGIDATPLPVGDLHVLSVDAALVPVRLVDFVVRPA